MKIIDKLLKFVGKENFQLDSAISKSYIIRKCWIYGLMMVRGKFFSMSKKHVANDIFVGKRVKVLEKRSLSIGKKVKLQEGVYIDALSEDGVTIGDNVVLGRNTRIECTGSLQNIGKGIQIGARTTFGNDCMFGAAGGIVIGEDVVAGQFIRFHSENHEYCDKNALIREQGVTHKGITIGDNCWIGAGVIFLDGAVLGDGCVVGANAVVTKKFADNVVIAGMSAKIIKSRAHENDADVEPYNL